MKTHHYLPASLARRFTLLMVIFLVLGVVLVTALSYVEHIVDARSEAREAAIDRSLTILDALETAATEESLSRFIFSVAAQPSVESIALVDPEGRVAVASKRSWQGADISVLTGVINEQWLVKQPAELINAYWDNDNKQAVAIALIEPVNPASVTTRDLEGGRLFFALDGKPYVASAAREAWVDALWAGSILIAMLLLVSGSLHRQVGRPLHKLYRQAHRPSADFTRNQPIAVGEIQELRVLAGAISELSHARAAVGQEKQRLADIADTIPGAVYEYRHYPDGDDQFLYFSEGIERLAGLEAGSLPLSDPNATGAAVWARVVPADYPKLERATYKTNYPEPAEWRAEFRVQADDGVRWIWGHALPVADDEPGQLFRGVMLDITERKNLEWRLKQAATHDSLTGALNRAGIKPQLESSLAVAQRHDHPMSVILLDIDYFKTVNDTHGHDLGDSVLVQLVSVLKGRLRKADSLSRWGGEEFLILLPDTDTRGAMTVANVLRQAVEQSEFEHQKPLTISLGVAEAMAEDSVKTLVRRADSHLYQAKRTGRNRVMGPFEPHGPTVPVE